MLTLNVQCYSLLETDADNLLDITAAQAPVDDRFVDTVQELWWEVRRDSAHHLSSNFWLDGAFGWVVVQERGTRVGSHHDDGVTEVDGTPFTVRQATVIEDLKE